LTSRKGFGESRGADGIVSLTTAKLRRESEGRRFFFYFRSVGDGGFFSVEGSETFDDWFRLNLSGRSSLEKGTSRASGSRREGNGS